MPAGGCCSDKIVLPVNIGAHWRVPAGAYPEPGSVTSASVGSDDVSARWRERPPGMAKNTSESTNRRHHRPHQIRGLAVHHELGRQVGAVGRGLRQRRRVGRAERDADGVHRVGGGQRPEGDRREHEQLMATGQQAGGQGRRRARDDGHEHVQAGAGEHLSQRAVVGVEELMLLDHLGGRAPDPLPHHAGDGAHHDVAHHHGDSEEDRVAQPQGCTVAAHRLRHPGPRSCLRSAKSAAPAATLRRSSTRITVVRSRPRSRRCTSLTPGWVRSTSLSWSTTGGVQRVIGMLTTTGPVRSSVRSGTVSSSPRISGWSLLRESLPRTVTMVSSASRLPASW